MAVETRVTGKLLRTEARDYPKRDGTQGREHIAIVGEVFRSDAGEEREVAERVTLSDDGVGQVKGKEGKPIILSCRAIAIKGGRFGAFVKFVGGAVVG